MRYMETEGRLQQFDEINNTLSNLRIQHRSLQGDHESLQRDIKKMQDESQRLMMEIRTLTDGKARHELGAENYNSEKKQLSSLQ